MAEKQEKIEVVDKRRVNAEAPAEEPAAEQPTPEEPAAEEPSAEETTAQAPPEEEPMGEEGPLPPDVDVYVLLSSMIGMLHGFAWQKMGFVASRATGQVDEDLPQAKVAIDTVQYLAGQLESKLSEAEIRELRRMVMDLQMNYLRKSGSGS